MQVLKAAHRVERITEVDSRGIRQVLAGSRGHLAQATHPAPRIGRRTRKALGPEDEQGDDADEQDLANADVEHR